MNDACDASAECAGKVTLKAAVTFAMPAADLAELALPAPNATAAEIDESPLARAVKDSLQEALVGSMPGLTAADITILSLSTARRRRLQAATGLEVNYKIEVAAAEATESVKVAATAAAETIATITIPAEATVSNAEITPTVTATAEDFVSYAYVKTAGDCSATTCSDECGATEETAADTYACHADNVAEADNTNCDGAGLTAPTSATVCCAAADPDTCVATPSPAPPPTPEPEPEPEDDDDKLVLILVLVGVGVLLLIGGVAWYCRDKEQPKTKEQLEAELEETRRKQDEMAP
jgi:hypothetical protein